MQRFLGLFIGLLVLIDAFLIAYAVGINVRKTTVVDPSLPMKAKATIPAAPTSSSTPTPSPAATPSNESGPVTDTPSAKESPKNND